MGGIAGLALRQGLTPEPAVLRAMLYALAHRGPGSSAVDIADTIALGHAGGCSSLAAGAATLLVDGDVAAAALPGSDGGALAACRRDALGAVAALDGPHALAFRDRAARRLVLARDRFGARPLYIAEIAGGIAFASQPGALLAAGLVRPALRREALDELLQMQFTTGAETIFEGIRRLLPGETVSIAEGAVVERRRQPALPAGGPEPITEADALQRFDAAFEASLRRAQQAAPGPGVILAAGIDAAAVLAMLARVAEHRVQAFSAVLDAAGAEAEAEATAAQAAAHGARHAPVRVTEADLWQHLPEIVAVMDDPAADHGIIATWFLARRARQEVAALLSGAGGNEIFAGYGRHRYAMRPWWLGGKQPRATGAFDHLPDVLREPPRLWRDGIAAAQGAAATPGRTRLQAAQAADIADWLPNDLLARLDRCLMAHAVEGRAPFLDAGVVAAGFRLPDALKVRGRSGTWLLREWLARHAPAAGPAAPKQPSFAILAGWIGGVGERLGPLVAAQPGVAAVARPDRVAALFRAAAADKHRGFAAWHLLFYALWHRAHVERLPVGGDVWQVLAPRG